MTGSFGGVLYLLILTPSNQICSKYLFKYQHSVKCTTYDYDNILVFIYDDVDTYVAAIIASEEPVRAGRWAERVRTAGSWDWLAVVLEIDVT